MEVKELKQILKDLPDDAFISLKNYYDKNKEAQYGEIECLESISENKRVVTFRIKEEDSYA